MHIERCLTVLPDDECTHLRVASQHRGHSITTAGIKCLDVGASIKASSVQLYTVVQAPAFQLLVRGFYLLSTVVADPSSAHPPGGRSVGRVTAAQGVTGVGRSVAYNVRTP